MDMVHFYISLQVVGRSIGLPFPEYLLPENRYKNDFWITKDGQLVYPYEMSDVHLVNTIAIINDRERTILRLYLLCDGDEHILDGIHWKPKRRYFGEQQKQVEKAAYKELWNDYRIYMLLRRELVIRQQERGLLI